MSYRGMMTNPITEADALAALDAIVKAPKDTREIAEARRLLAEWIAQELHINGWKQP